MDRLFADVPQGIVDYDMAVNEFLASCQPADVPRKLQDILSMYRQSDPSVTKTIRLLSFLNHLILKHDNILCNQALEDWILTCGIMYSCLQGIHLDMLRSLGITSFMILGALKLLLHVFQAVPLKSTEPIHIHFFETGTDLLGLFLAILNSMATTAGFPSSHTVVSAQGHVLVGKAVSELGIEVIKQVLLEINLFPPSVSTADVNCINRGKELINMLLLGPESDGSGIVSHYDIILALPLVYGPFLRGTFAQSVHWTMEKFINELGKRRRHLAFLMMPPDASWPLICHVSRRHEYNNLTTRASYRMFEGDLIEFAKEGNSTNVETHFRDMLFQRASMDEFRQLVLSLVQSKMDTSSFRRAMMTKIHDTIRCLQQLHGSGKVFSADNDRRDVWVSIPSNVSLWELMIETADQLYSFVSADVFSYEDIVNDIYDMVYNPQSEYHLEKDNGLVWLLLQLLMIDKVSNNAIKQDFEHNEVLFDKLVRLHNEEQLSSSGAFSLRDLSFQCATNCMKKYFRDIPNIQQRHPQMVANRQHAELCYNIQKTFRERYHNHVSYDSKLLCNIDLSTMVEVALVSQLQQDLVPYTLYVYLVPTKIDISYLASPGATFNKGGSLSYKLLDLISINAKHRLLQLIYKMMLDSEQGPRYQQQKEDVQITCVSPFVLDAVYKLLYSAPCSGELMIKEIFDKLRQCDKVVKTLRVDNQIAPSARFSFPDPSIRWIHAILQLMNYRFLRFLKYSPLSSSLLHFVRYLISHLEHRQVFKALESFAGNAMRIQTDMKFLKSLIDPNREKEVWFPESEPLARLAVLTICRLIKTRGLADFKVDDLFRMLKHLYPYKMDWSPTTLTYFPEPIRKFYTDIDSPNQTLPQRDHVQQSEVAKLASNFSYLLRTGMGDQQGVVQYFSDPNRLPYLLCLLWKVAVDQQSADMIHIGLVRKLLLLIPPPRMATCVVDFINFVLKTKCDSTPQLLETMIWKYQWIDFNYAVIGLVNGGRSIELMNESFALLRSLLLSSNEFNQRMEKWKSLKFSSRYWTEEDFSNKLAQYHQEFPDYHEFEAQLQNEQHPLDPEKQPAVPTYYANVILDFIPTLEIVIMRLIEHTQTDLLINVLDKCGHLFHYHQCALAFVCDMLLYYSNSDTLRDPRVCKRFVQLIDFDQYDLLPEAVDYTRQEGSGEALFDRDYFERVVQKLSFQLNPHGCAPRTNDKLPERHFREMSNPAVQAISIAILEIMLAPIPPPMIVKYLLDLVLLRDSRHVGVSALTINAIGVLFSNLPSDAFGRPMWESLNELIATDPYLLEISEPVRLTRCGVPKRIHGRYAMVPTLPDLTTTPALKDAMNTRFRKAMIYPYIFNDYTFNLHNYSTNAPNTFLTLIHSIMHYSSLDIFHLFLEYIKTLRMSGTIKTDVQLLYVCALIGPALHRIEKLSPLDACFSVELMHLVKQVTVHIDMKDGWSTRALEQVFDFLNHIRPGFVKTNELAKQLRDIIRSVSMPTAQRLQRLVM